MSDSSQPVLDENTRRYYLDTMGVQCWQLLEPMSDSESIIEPEIEREVKHAATEVVTEAVELPQEAADVPLTWLSLEDSIQQCDRCHLQQTRSSVVAAQGNQSAELMIVLLSTAMDVEASKLLAKMLAAIDIKLEDVYITSLLKCELPPQHTVSMVEIKACSHFLNQQIQLLKPKQLFVLGETTARCLYQKNLQLDALREQVNVDADMRSSEHAGFVSPVIDVRIPLLLSYSPQELQQQPENKRKSWSDLQLLQRRLQ